MYEKIVEQTIADLEKRIQTANGKNEAFIALRKETVKEILAIIKDLLVTIDLMEDYDAI